MGTRSTPPPLSLPPETATIDESWEDFLVGDPGADDEVFDRATAVPTAPPSTLGSDPPDSGGRAAVLPEPPRTFDGKAAGPLAPTVRVPLPGGRAAGERGFDPKRTQPEPLVERSLARVEAGGGPAPADRLEQLHARATEKLELDLDSDRESPLDLVETYRRAAESLPGGAPADPAAKSRRGERESGTLEDMQDRYAVGDFTGALVVAESILDSDPDNEDAKRYAQSCREVLTQMYAARIGPMDQIATVAVPPDQITWLSLDHRAGFLLSLVDGVSSIEEILDVSGMTRLDALRIMYTLVQQNVITLRT